MASVTSNSGSYYTCWAKEAESAPRASCGTSALNVVQCFDCICFVYPTQRFDFKSTSTTDAPTLSPVPSTHTKVDFGNPGVRVQAGFVKMGGRDSGYVGSITQIIEPYTIRA